MKMKIMNKRGQFEWVEYNLHQIHSDYEDALKYYTAIHYELDYFVPRDIVCRQSKVLATANA